MLKRTFFWRFQLPVIFILFFIPTIFWGYDLTDSFSIGGVLSGAYQHQTGEDIEDRGRGAIAFQPELSLRLTDRDEIFTKFGFAAGNGLKKISEFNFAPWAADLEDDVKNINGRDRDYLLTAWYKHTFEFSDKNALGLTGGIIDATDYIDDNAFTSDEYKQFMNEALVNASNGFFPSYDIGGVLEWDIGNWHINVVGMNVGQAKSLVEGAGNNDYNYFGGQIRYNLNTLLGEGNYRLTGDLTSKDFLDKDGNEQRRLTAGISFDQKLGKIFGAWIRFGWQDDEAPVKYDYLLSGGLNITGRWYGREDDNIGIGYAYFDGANDSDFDFTQVAEFYWRFVLNDFFALTADVQYMNDEFNTDKVDIDGFILGVRGTVEF